MADKAYPRVRVHKLRGGIWETAVRRWTVQVEHRPRPTEEEPESAPPVSTVYAQQATYAGALEVAMGIAASLSWQARRWKGATRG